MPAPKFVGIQSLRFVAALMVVITHTTYMIGERIYGVGMTTAWREGNAGVDIFFVISGFVMMTSGRSFMNTVTGARDFIIRRLLRIVPLYWFATTLKLLAVLLIPAATIHSGIDPLHVISSYLFLPHHNVDHDVMPLVAVGWTLMFEMFFYTLFAAALYLKRSPIGVVLPIFMALSCLSLLRQPEAGAWQFYLDPILMEFALGMLAARLIRNGLVMQVRHALALMALAFASLLLPSDLYGSERAIGWGLPAFVIVLCTAAIEPFLSKHLPRVLSYLGDTSYALYLFHGFYVPIVGIALLKLGIAQPAFAFALSVAGSIVLGAAVHRFIEIPLGSWLKPVLVKPKLAAVAG
jgi:exopolysaccharide production protein ExoZ